MRINSKFKDYYDFVSHRYGADPTCVYMRGKVPGAGDIVRDWKKPAAHPFAEYKKDVVGKSFDASAPHEEWSVEYIIAGEVVFPVLAIYVRTHNEATNETVGGYTYRLLGKASFEYLNRGYYAKGWDAFNESMQTRTAKAQVRALIKKAGVPVFKMKFAGAVCRIDELTPILKEYGIPSVCAPEVMWQGIYTTMTSVLRHDPDKAVPVKLANNARVEKAGFDLKTSFRHPVNVKKPRKGKKAKV